MVHDHRFHKWDRVRVSSERTRYFGKVGQIVTREGGPSYQVQLDEEPSVLGFDDRELEPEA